MPPGMMLRKPAPEYPTAVRLPITATALKGTCELPLPVLATETTVRLLGALIPPVMRVSITRKGLKFAPKPSAVSVRTELMRFQRPCEGMPDRTLTACEAQIEPSLPRTSSCWKLTGPTVLLTMKKDGFQFGDAPPTSLRPTIPRRPEPVAGLTLPSWTSYPEVDSELVWNLAAVPVVALPCTPVPVVTTPSTPTPLVTDPRTPIPAPLLLVPSTPISPATVDALPSPWT